MCICVFPDCSILTSLELWYISKPTKMHTLTLMEVQDSLIYGQSGQNQNRTLGWIKWTPGSLTKLYITGELPWHGHTISQHGNTADTDTLVMQFRQVYSCW